MHSGSALALLALLPGEVLSHGVLVSPRTREAAGMRGDGAKLTPFFQAKDLADGGCGGVANGDPGVGRPRQAFRPGSQIKVEWDLTIPHPADNENTGVRIAIHYGPDESFDKNILAGGVAGSGVPGFSAEQIQGEKRQSATLTLPVGKTCDYCTLQWVWAASSDGGLYIGCADIAITETGQRPDYDALPSEEGNVLPGVPATSGPGGIDPSGGGDVPGPNGGGGGGSGGDDGGGAGVGVGVTFAILIIGGGCAYVYFKYFKDGNNSNKAPPPPPSGEATWVTQMGPSAPGQPMQQAPPPPPQPTAGSLPPGWTSAVDPGSGQTYYVNMTTGMTQWSPPIGAGAHV